MVPKQLKNSTYTWLTAAGCAVVAIANGFTVEGISAPEEFSELARYWGCGLGILLVLIGLNGNSVNLWLWWYGALPSTEKTNVSPRPNIRVKQAIPYLCHESKWDGVTGDPNDGWYALREIMEAASTGQIVMWGKNIHGNVEKITLEKLALSNTTSALFDHTTENTSELEVKAGMGSYVYRQLRIDRAQMEDLWPPKG